MSGGELYGDGMSGDITAVHGRVAVPGVAQRHPDAEEKQGGETYRSWADPFPTTSCGASSCIWHANPAVSSAALHMLRSTGSSPGIESSNTTSRRSSIACRRHAVSVWNTPASSSPPLVSTVYRDLLASAANLMRSAARESSALAEMLADRIRPQVACLACEHQEAAADWIARGLPVGLTDSQVRAAILRPLALCLPHFVHMLPSLDWEAAQLFAHAQLASLAAAWAEYDTAANPTVLVRLLVGANSDEAFLAPSERMSIASLADTQAAESTRDRDVWGAAESGSLPTAQSSWSLAVAGVTQHADRLADLLDRMLGDAGIARRYEDASGVCFRHLPLAIKHCTEPSNMRLLLRTQYTREAVMHWELEEYWRKHDWTHRWEPRGDEQAAWYRAVGQYTGTAATR